jgi:integrase
MTRRPAGLGTIEPLRSGRFRARVPLADGNRHTVGTFDTEEEAEGMISAVIERAAAENLAPVGGMTVRGLLRAWQDDLELSRSYVAMPNVRSIGRRWIETADFADWPIRRVTRTAIEQWARGLRKAGLGDSYAKQAIVHLRKAFAFAVETRRLDESPAERVKLPRGTARTEEPWTYLTPEEQAALVGCQELPRKWQLRIAFAIGTGLRAGEMLSLRLADLHVGENPHVVVRYGSRRRAPKSRKIREVPLFGMALDAARDQVELLRGARNPNALAFPGDHGGFEKVSRVPGWQDWLKAAGIERRVRWHDLRHTCGASLVSGWWGRAWTLIEVRDLMGHHSVKMTERYAHLGDTALKAAAAGTLGPGGGTGGFGGPRAVHAGTQASEIAPNVLVPRHSPESQHNLAESHGNQDAVGSAWATVRAPAERLARAAAAGEDCGDLLRALAAAVLATRPVALAAAALAGGPHALDRGLELAALILEQEPKALGGVG